MWVFSVAGAGLVPIWDGCIAKPCAKCIIWMIVSLFLTTILEDKYCDHLHLHFEETEALRTELTYPRVANY